MSGYVCYADRFCGTLDALPERLDYLAELGVTYLHLMPLLQPRPGENDGGYAVMDYRAVDPRLGTMDDLEAAARALRERGMSLCVDLVLNHTAREHAWAQGWLAGDPAYADFYTAFPDRKMPDAYERDDPARSSRTARRARSPGSAPRTAAAAAGCGRRSGLPVGPRLREPRGLRWRCSTTILWLANRGDRRLPHGRRPVHVEAAGHDLP